MTVLGLVRSHLARQFGQHNSKRLIFRKMVVDASIPIHRGMEKLDRDAFRKTAKVLAVEVTPETTNTVLKSPAMRGVVIDLPRVKSVVPAPGGRRYVLTRFTDESELPPVAKQFLEEQSAKLASHTLNFDYDYWTSDDILSSILPEELAAEAPSGFAIVGHIAHLNLNDEYLPYKHLIGQVILDKNSTIKTVVNKLDSIDNKFRVFKMEVIAGESNFEVVHHEAESKFTFDFSKVYWNSRLHTEHARLVDLFKPEDVIADVFAGVGPFAIPAGKKGCGVFANDLNPSSHEYLVKNIADNRVKTLVRPSCEDGKDFIRAVVARALDKPLPPAQPVLSKTQALKARRGDGRDRKLSTSQPPGSPRNRITHFVMNLPASAITFLDAFRGILSPQNVGGRDLSEIYGPSDLPTVHCYCFSREADLDNAYEDIRQRVEEQIGHPLAEKALLHHVRSVAPNKEMYCISFKLPREVAFGN